MSVLVTFDFFQTVCDLDSGLTFSGFKAFLPHTSSFGFLTSTKEKIVIVIITSVLFLKLSYSSLCAALLNAVNTTWL